MGAVVSTAAHGVWWDAALTDRLHTEEEGGEHESGDESKRERNGEEGGMDVMIAHR